MYKKVTPNVNFYTQYFAEVTSASDSQNKTSNKGFIESYEQFPLHIKRNLSSPADQGENVSHVSETPPGRPSPDTNEAATCEKETAGTKIFT